MKICEFNEFMPYKQRVAGSNPAVPTLKINHLLGLNQVGGFFIYIRFAYNCLLYDLPKSYFNL